MSEFFFFCGKRQNLCQAAKKYSERTSWWETLGDGLMLELKQHSSSIWFVPKITHFIPFSLQSTWVLTFWSQCQVLPCSMSAVHSGAAAGCVQGPAHTWLGISRPPAQALLKATHGRQGRSGGCESRKKNRLQIKVLKVSVWAKILLITTRQLLLSAFSIVLDLNTFFFSQFSFVRLSPVMAGSLFW